MTQTPADFERILKLCGCPGGVIEHRFGCQGLADSTATQPKVDKMTGYSWIERDPRAIQVCPIIRSFLLCWKDYEDVWVHLKPEILKSRSVEVEDSRRRRCLEWLRYEYAALWLRKVHGMKQAASQLQDKETGGENRVWLEQNMLAMLWDKVLSSVPLRLVLSLSGGAEAVNMAAGGTAAAIASASGGGDAALEIAKASILEILGRAAQKGELIVKGDRIAGREYAAGYSIAFMHKQIVPIQTATAGLVQELARMSAPQVVSPAVSEKIENTAAAQRELFTEVPPTEKEMVISPDYGL